MARRLSLWLICILLAGPCFAAPESTLHKHPAPNAIAHFSQESIRVGSLNLHRCPNAPAYCGSVLQALDPIGEVPGTIEIQFEYYLHIDTSQDPLEPIMAAEGGPGYATTGSSAEYLGLFAPLLDRRDLLLVDERGTGNSQALY